MTPELNRHMDVPPSCAPKPHMLDAAHLSNSTALVHQAATLNPSNSAAPGIPAVITYTPLPSAPSPTPFLSPQLSRRAL